MIFRQLIEPESSTYTYLIGCEKTGEAVLLDPVVETCERDLEEVAALGLKLAFTLDTHIHADHITGACRLRSLTGCKVVYPADESLSCADVAVNEAAPLVVGDLIIHALFTPGHTDKHHCYLIEQGNRSQVFTGDALLIDGCGRTDFQNGDSATLYKSVREKLFTLPPDTLVYPAHDYEGRRVSTIMQERTRNPRLNDQVSLREFQQIMARLDLPYPKKIDVAVPANLKCGDCVEDAAEHLHEIGGKSPQG
ncbi:MAG: Zn-dependent hydrolase [Erythrobacter sp. 34-65-8]|nr:MAG: Zn-dependent hydrolase [Erythrobacter sp. 34-65-8]